MVAIVLVGGKRSLVSALYPELPPSLIPVNHQPFLYWLTLWLKKQGVQHIVYSAGHYANKISAWVNHMADLEPHLCLDVVCESRPLGTAGATALCSKRFPSPYKIIVNGNSLLLTDLRLSLERLKSNPMLDGMIVGTHVANAGRFGTLETTPSHHLLAFKEKQPGTGAVNAGIYLLRHRLLDGISTEKALSLEYDCFPRWLTENKHFEVITPPADFVDIGTPDALQRAHVLIQNNLQWFQCHSH